MTYSKTKRMQVIALIGAFCLSIVALAGCAAGEKAPTPAEANRAYMSSMSQATENLGTELDAFVAAVGENDLAAMKIASDRAEKAMTAIKDLKPSESLQPVHDEYSQGIDSLQSALDSYIDLYTQVEKGTLSAADLKVQLTSVQNAYDDGVKHLEKGDTMVVELAGPQDKKAAKNSSADAASSEGADA